MINDLFTVYGTAVWFEHTGQRTVDRPADVTTQHQVCTLAFGAGTA
jgi:hypothetical protein